MKIRIAFGIAAASLAAGFFIAGCGDGPVAGTDAGNATKVIGTVLSPSGMPVARTAVWLRTADYQAPAADSLLMSSLGKEWSDTTGADGGFAFSLDPSDTGGFVVEAMVKQARGAIASFQRAPGPLQQLGPLVLQPMGGIHGQVALPPDVAGGVVITLPGTNRYQYLPSGTGVFTFDTLPPGQYVLHAEGVQPTRNIADTVIDVAPGQTVAANAIRFKIKALIVDGIANHDWQRMTLYNSAILNQTGIFEVAVSTQPPIGSTPAQWAGWHPNFSDYDVVILHCNSGYGDQDSVIPWPDSMKAKLQAFVNGGGGLVNTHATFPDGAGWPALDTLHGLVWRYYQANGPSYKIDSSDNLVADPVTVDLGSFEPVTGTTTLMGTANPTHPINLGLPAQWMHDGFCLPFRLKGDPTGITVVTDAVDPVTGNREPILWTKSSGKGRVFTDGLGHLLVGDANTPYRCAGYQTTFVRGVEWAATDTVTLPVPTDFPTPTSVSLRNNLP